MFHVDTHTRVRASKNKSQRGRPCNPTFLPITGRVQRSNTTMLWFWGKRGRVGHELRGKSKQNYQMGDGGNTGFQAEILWCQKMYYFFILITQHCQNMGDAVWGHNSCPELFFSSFCFKSNCSTIPPKNDIHVRVDKQAANEWHQTPQPRPWAWLMASQRVNAST